MMRMFAPIVTLLGLLGPAAAGDGGDLIGSVTSHVVEEGETLLNIARDHGLGFVELRAANPGIDAWVPMPGSRSSCGHRPVRTICWMAEAIERAKPGSAIRPSKPSRSKSVVTSSGCIVIVLAARR
jgi:hypothetical protein